MLHKIVLTGAAGRLGHLCRKPLAALCETLLSSDLADTLPDLAPNETYARADVGHYDQVAALMQDASMVVHFASIADEAPWERILHSNILSSYHIWESAYQAGVRRIIYASSIHAVGMYPKNQFINTAVPHRPDTFYGLAKCFGEDLASLYWDKRGVEAVAMRILSAPGKPTASRNLSTWQSDRDLVQLVTKSVTSPTTGFTVVYGVSNNDRVGVDNALASHLGYRPQDNAEHYADRILPHAPPQDPQNPEDMCHGGPFAVVPLGESGVEMIRKRSLKSG